ncbi:NAD(P)-binding domain-containing protein [Falsiroseomonas sp. HW251]|uniref:NAD(P)-binding domain-containing protein n=1 Tax=Falsiroseomonas sp. HW251 TaxID=3390998 RepID=UPI003D3101E9
MSTDGLARIGFLGLGAMGSRMAGRLLTAGHLVTVWNRTPEATAALAVVGARVVATPAEAAAGADIVMAMLRDDEASRDVWTRPGTGALSGMPAGALAVECSTLTPGWVRQLGAMAAAVIRSCALSRR